MHTPGVGAKTFINLISDRSPEQISFESQKALRALGLKDESIRFIHNPDWHTIETDLLWLEQAGNVAITYNDPNYPPQLKEISTPPPILFVKGDPKLLSLPQIAMVGSRNPSNLGIETGMNFAYTLSQKGFVITSGLALGIDAACHQGALKANGKTIAVAGTGPDRIYPARNKQLAMEIIAQGAIITEFPPGTPAKANHFPRRNRIISGLCQGLLVVEAAKQSGSLITARQALEQNREVFAIPGSIHNPLARGCNALIRDGAKLVETAEDIIEELGQYNQEVVQPVHQLVKSTLDLEQQTLLNLIMFSPTSIDDLVKTSEFSVEVISSMLLVLELEGFIESLSGGCYIRIK